MATRRYKRKRKSAGGFILSLLTFLIVVGAIVTSLTVFLKVSEIEVSGTTRYDTKDIIKTSGIEIGDNMILLNKFEVADRILEEYPYIEKIKIRRRFPDKFTFEITERVPLAYVMSGETRWLIDKYAYIVELVEKDTEIKLPKITGATVLSPRLGEQLMLENEDQLPVLTEVLSAVSTAELTEKLDRIEIEKLYDLNLVYDSRFMVNLGDTTSLSQKIEMLRAVLNELSDFDKGTINVSAVKEARFKPNSNIDLSEKRFDLITEEEPAEMTEDVPEEAPVETEVTQ